MILRDSRSLASSLSSAECHACDRSGQLYSPAGSQTVCEQPLTPTVFPVYVKLIPLTNTVPLFHFPHGVWLTFSCRFRSLEQLCENQSGAAQSSHRKGLKAFLTLHHFHPNIWPLRKGICNIEASKKELTSVSSVAWLSKSTALSLRCTQRTDIFWHPV